MSSEDKGNILARVGYGMIWPVSVLAATTVVLLPISFARTFHSVKILIKDKGEEKTDVEEGPHHKKKPPLFKYCPVVDGRIPWIDIGQKYPTPLHVFVVDGVEISFKREDLICDRYGGNKVRTLEFLLPAAGKQMSEEDLLHVMGGVGSNQIVATGVYAGDVGIPPERVESFAAFYEEPSYANGLNLLSMESFSKLRA